MSIPDVGGLNSRIRCKAMLLLYPRLRAFPFSGWSNALQRARETPMDMLELIGVIAAVGLATWLMRGVVFAPELISATLMNVARFFLAIPLLVLMAGPFLLRRTRRGLEQLSARQHAARPSVHASQGGRS